MDGWVSSFQYEEIKSMLAEEMEGYTLAYVEAAYEDPGEQATMVFMAAGGGFNDGIFLTGGIRSIPIFLARLAQRRPNGRPAPCT